MYPIIKKKLSIVIATMGIILYASSAQVLAQDALEEKIALHINLNGYLCARITNVVPIQGKDTYRVTCVEFRGGSSTATYIFAVKSDGISVRKQ